MAVPSMIGQPGTLILYSRSHAAFGARESTLGALGVARHLGADACTASLHEPALLSAMYGMFGGFVHAAAPLRSESIRATEFKALVVSWLNAMTSSLRRMAQALGSGDHSAAQSNVRMQAASFVNLLEASSDPGVSTELVEPTKHLVAPGVAAGFGDGAISALIKLLHTHPVAVEVLPFGRRPTPRGTGRETPAGSSAGACQHAARPNTRGGRSSVPTVRPAAADGHGAGAQRPADTSRARTRRTSAS